jgi:tetratricopeptide (TPR) repeat protein
VRRAAATAPGAPDVQFNLANALQRRGALDEAVAHYRAAGATSDTAAKASAHARVGSIRRQQKRLDEALAELKEAVRLRPDYGEFHDRYANALNDAGRIAEAEVEYKAAIALGPKEEESARRRNYAILLVNAGRNAEALEQARLAVALEPGGVTYELLAFVLASSGQTAEAVQALEQAVQRDPQNAALRSRLEQLRRGAAPRGSRLSSKHP